jgi:hypothetical protein
MSTAIAVSERAAVFCQHVISGHPPPEAAKLAGYKNPVSTAQAMMAHPQIRRALREGAEGFLLSDLLPASLRVMGDLLADDDPKAAAVRGKLSVAIFDRATRAGPPGEDATRALAQLTTDQLAELVARGAAAQVQEANTLDVTPRVTPAAGA